VTEVNQLAITAYGKQKADTSISGCREEKWYFLMKTLAEYLQFYHHERIHLGKYLNGLTPHEKWQEWLSTVLPLKVN